MTLGVNQVEWRVLKVAAWSLLMLLGLFMIVSAFTGMNVALTQSNVNNSETTSVVIVASAQVPTTVPSPDKTIIGLRLNVGGWSDPANNALWQGVANALRDTPAATFEVVLYDEASALAPDVNLVFTTGVSREQLERDSEQHPDTRFVSLVVTDPDITNNPANRTSTKTLKNVFEVTFEEHETSYLLGYLAGTLSQTGQVGFVGDTQTPRTVANQAAFLQGLVAACSPCQLYSEFVGSNTDTVLAASAAQTLSRKGADILFTDAGDASQGVINFVTNTMCSAAAPTRPSPLTSALTLVAKDINYLSECAGSYPLFFIGTGSYQPSSGDNDNDPNTLNHGLTSLTKRVDLAVYQAIETLLAHNALETQQFTLEDDAVTLAIDDYNRALLPSEVLAQLENLKAQIISGKIVVDTELKE